jgi:cold shock protein
MPTGTISYWNSPKGFGFARKDDGGEVFVHVNDLVDETIEALEVGQHIAFDEHRSKRGNKPEAVEVKLLTTRATEAKDHEPRHRQQHQYCR